MFDQSTRRVTQNNAAINATLERTSHSENTMRPAVFQAARRGYVPRNETSARTIKGLACPRIARTTQKAPANPALHSVTLTRPLRHGTGATLKDFTLCIGPWACHA